MNSKKWLIICISSLLSGLVLVGSFVAYIDPFFHYHAPIEGINYKLKDQRHQSDGIAKHFDYDGIVCGTSITQNFAPSMMDQAYGTKSIKLCLPGATYKEISDILDASYESGHELKYVLRSMDYTSLIKNKDEMRTDLGEYPTYLYDKNPFNDVNYLFNMDVLINWCIKDLKRSKKGNADWDNFDKYDRLYGEAGREYVLEGRTSFDIKAKQECLNQEEIEDVKANISQNIERLVAENPTTQFHYFFPCYSIAFWGVKGEQGTMDKYLEAEKIAIEMLLPYENVSLYGFNNETDIITDIDSYMDMYHYSSDINNYIMECIIVGDNKLTYNNYEEYLKNEWDYFHDYDYNSLIVD